MKFIKYLDRDDMIRGDCNPHDKMIRINFSHGLSEAVLATIHEFYHFIVGNVWYSIPNPYCQERQIDYLFDFLNNFIHRTPL
jgi:hypothetical protein